MEDGKGTGNSEKGLRAPTWVSFPQKPFCLNQQRIAQSCSSRAPASLRTKGEPRASLPLHCLSPHHLEFSAESAGGESADGVHVAAKAVTTSDLTWPYGLGLGNCDAAFDFMSSHGMGRTPRLSLPILTFSLGTAHVFAETY